MRRAVEAVADQLADLLSSAVQQARLHAADAERAVLAVPRRRAARADVRVGNALGVDGHAVLEPQEAVEERTAPEDRPLADQVASRRVEPRHREREHVMLLGEGAQLALPDRERRIFLFRCQRRIERAAAGGFRRLLFGRHLRNLRGGRARGKLPQILRRQRRRMRRHLVEEHAVPVFRRKEHPLRGGALDVVVHRVLHLCLRSDLLAVHPERQLVAPAHDREMVPASVRHRRAARNGRPRQRGREPSLGRQEHRHLRVARELLSTRERRHKTRVEGEGEVAPRR